jgi:hypothetical protein
MIQLQALDAFVINGDHPLETEVNKFHHAAFYIILFAEVSKGIRRAHLILVPHLNLNRNPPPMD